MPTFHGIQWIYRFIGERSYWKFIIVNAGASNWMNGIFERFKQRPISKGKRNDRLSLWIEIFHPNVFFFSSGHVPCVPLKASREMFSRFSHSNIRNGMKTRTISCTLKCAVCNLKRPLKSFIACEVGNQTISAVTLYYRRTFFIHNRFAMPWEHFVCAVCGNYEKLMTIRFRLRIWIFFLLFLKFLRTIVIDDSCDQRFGIPVTTLFNEIHLILCAHISSIDKKKVDFFNFLVGFRWVNGYL